MTASHPKTPSKTTCVVAMLERPKGASLDALCKATGWQSHSARAALSGLRKAGYAIEQTPGDGKMSRSYYRISSAPKAAK